MEELEKLVWDNSQKESQKLKEYTIQKWQWIFRVFVNLWLNYNEKTKNEIGKLQEILTKKNWIKEPIWIKEGDKYILDANFLVHIERNWKEIFKYPLLKLEEKEKEKINIKWQVIKDVKKHKDNYNENRLKELVNELDKEARLKYYLDLALDNNETWGKNEEELVEEKTEKKLKKKKEIIPANEKEEEKTFKPKKKREKIYIVKHPKEKTWIQLSKEMKRNILNHIERINPWFKEHLWHVYDLAKEYKLHPALLIAVMQNDSWLWKHLYSKNNLWNIWNTDKLVSSWKKWVEFKSPRKWIKALARNLRDRVDSYNELYPNRAPSTKEIMSWISRDWTKFYGRYMSKQDWPEKVNNFYNQIASR